jgi:hypothetical protein
MMLLATPPAGTGRVKWLMYSGQLLSGSRS